MNFYQPVSLVNLEVSDQGVYQYSGCYGLLSVNVWRYYIWCSLPRGTWLQVKVKFSLS
jgi:hypothetical protein